MGMQALCELRMFGHGPGGAAHKMQEVLMAAAGAGRESLLEDVRGLAARVLPMQALDAAPAAPSPASVAATQPLSNFQACPLAAPASACGLPQPLAQTLPRFVWHAACCP
jgi:hypothetical protein